MRNISALRVIVQSSHKDPVHLDGRIEHFLHEYRATVLETMTAEELQVNVQAVIETLTEKPKNLGEVSDALVELIVK
jgi:secreted Zn-dependent insulinase-like peptidase